jgi:16S rRNA (guanine527-N7)-methyltransferase
MVTHKKIPNEQNKEKLANYLAQKLVYAGYNINHSVQEKIIAYLSLLHKWNSVYNLTRITQPEDMVTRHILDSLSIRSYLQGQQILDVGSGAGLPGIPLALVEPDRTFQLLDSNAKKTRFLLHVVQELQIKNIKISQARVENFIPNYCFDTVMSRAFSSLSDFIKLTQHLCCKNGQWLAMKGQYPQEELAEIDETFAAIVYDVPVKGLDAKRHIVILKKKHQSNCNKDSSYNI